MGRLRQLAVINMNRLFSPDKKDKGFTLIEMMVAVSIFVIVAFIVVSSLLTLSYAYKRAQKMRLLMDNLGFSTQNMSLNIREGVDYSTPSCPIGGVGNCLQFQAIDSWLKKESKYVCYSLSSTEGIIKCVDGCLCSDYTDLTSPEIKITKLNFEVRSGATSPKNSVKIFVAGEAGTGREYTNFFIQNTVSQRNIK